MIVGVGVGVLMVIKGSRTVTGKTCFPSPSSTVISYILENPPGDDEGRGLTVYSLSFLLFIHPCYPSYQFDHSAWKAIQHEYIYDQFSTFDHLLAHIYHRGMVNKGEEIIRRSRRRHSEGREDPPLEEYPTLTSTPSFPLTSALIP